MLQNQKNFLTLNERIVFQEHGSPDADGFVKTMPLGAVWAHVEFLGLRNREFDQDVPHYRIIFRKNRFLESRLDRLVRLHWKCKVLQILHLFSPPQKSQASNYYEGIAYEKRCEG